MFYLGEHFCVFVKQKKNCSLTTSKLSNGQKETLSLNKHLDLLLIKNGPSDTFSVHKLKKTFGFEQVCAFKPFRIKI